MIGTTVIAVVERVEPYGVYLNVKSEKILVLIPDVSTERISDLQELFKPGDKLSVKVLRFVDEKGMYKGTLLNME